MNSAILQCISAAWSSTLEVVCPRLVASYAMNAEAGKDQAPKTFTAKATRLLLEQVANQSSQAFRAVGLGDDLRFEAVDVLGQGLCVEDRLLHLSVFPPVSDRPRAGQQAPAIDPPSRRKTRRA